MKENCPRCESFKGRHLCGSCLNGIQDPKEQERQKLRFWDSIDINELKKAADGIGEGAEMASFMLKYKELHDQEYGRNKSKH